MAEPEHDQSPAPTGDPSREPTVHAAPQGPPQPAPGGHYGAATPGLTACSLCAGETLGDGDDLEGGQAERLRRIAAAGLARLTLTECLDECERGDVVVVRPSATGRRCAGRPVWFERLAGDAPTSHLQRWLRDGGPGVAQVPSALGDLRLRRDRDPDADA